MNAPTAKEPEPKTSGPGRLEKVPTGIQGLDEITCGGLPRGRTTLVCGGPGCGKTLMALEFLVHGATRFGEPGVFIAFEETAGELATNGASLGFDLAALEADRKLAIDYVRIERSEIEESGEYDLEGLFIRIGFAIDSIGARRVAIDTLEVLFAGLPSPGILRAELRRLFHWLKEKGLTAIVTAERGGNGLTRHGLEEYISDCVITLDQRVSDQITTRRLRVVKYRGSAHDTDEVPFLIDERGLSVLPISSLGLDHQAATSRVSSGIPDLDAMLGGGGFFRGSTVLVSGGAGYREDQPGGQLRPAGLRRRQALPVLHVRGVPQPGRPQHALHRHRPGAPDGAGPPPLPCVAVQRHRPGDAPGPDASAGLRFRARGRRHRSDDEPARHRDRQ